MLRIPEAAGLSRAALGPGVAGEVCLLRSSVCFFSLGALVPPAPGQGGGGAGWDVTQHAALGVFSQSEAMAAACTLLTAAVKTPSRPAAR